MEERINELIEENRLPEAVDLMESMVMDSPWILDTATKEEIGAYNIIESLPEEDYKKLLENMIKILGKELSDVEKKDMRKISREALKIILIQMWLERYNQKTEGENEGN